MLEINIIWKNIELSLLIPWPRSFKSLPKLVYSWLEDCVFGMKSGSLLLEEQWLYASILGEDRAKLDKDTTSDTIENSMEADIMKKISEYVSEM